MKLIDKDALVAEINMYLEYANNGILYAQSGIEHGLKEYESDLNGWQHCQSMCNNILSFLNNLEVKEVDLEKNINSWYYLLNIPENYNIPQTVMVMDIVEKTAKHFFDLGFKVQKGE